MTNKEAKEILIEERDSLKANPMLIVEDCLYDAFDVAIKTLEQTRWIPCTERLPGTDEDVLVTNGRGVYVGWRYIGIDSTDRGWRVDSESEYFMDDIIAWMPLPKPYKVEKL